MCETCGCGAVDPLLTLVAQHEQILAAASALRRALERDDLATAELLRLELLRLLDPHERAETRGVLAELRGHPEHVEVVDGLIAGHDRIDAALRAQPMAWGPVLVAVELLWRHVDIEEHMIFPIARAVIDAAGWARIGAAVADALGDGHRAVES